MRETDNTIIGVEAWRKELLLVMRDILDCEPVLAMDRIDRMLGELEEPKTRH